MKLVFKLTVAIVLVAAPVLAWRRRDLHTVVQLSFVYVFGLVSLAPYYQDKLVTIYHGDCTSVLPTIRSESVDLVWTDPPYGNSNQSGDLQDSLLRKNGRRGRPIANDGRKSMMRIVDFALDEAARILKRESACCVCSSGGGGANGPMFAWLANRMDVDGLKFFHCVIWDKINPGLGWRYRRRHEMVMVSFREDGNISWANSEVAVPNIISCTAPYRRQHPNQKPEELVGRFIQLHTRPGDLIVDPFMGSGTTLLVAKKLRRRAIGIELEKQYCRNAAARLKELEEV